MKKSVMSMVLVMCLALTACNTRKTETTPSVTASTVSSSETNTNGTTESTGVKDVSIEVHNQGDYAYTLTFIDKDECKYVYTGSTNTFTLCDLCAEIQEFTPEFRYTIKDGYFESIRGSQPTDGYFATYINNRYVEDVTLNNEFTMVTPQYNVEIKYVTDNVFFANPEFRIPSVDDIYKITVVDLSDPVITETYSFYDQDGIQYIYSIEKEAGEYKSFDEGKSKFTFDDFTTLRDLILAADVEVLGNKLPEPNDYKYMIIVNNYICLTNASTITDFLAQVEKPSV